MSKGNIAMSLGGGGGGGGESCDMYQSGVHNTIVCMHTPCSAYKEYIPRTSLQYNRFYFLFLVASLNHGQKERESICYENVVLGNLCFDAFSCQFQERGYI